MIRGTHFLEAFPVISTEVRNTSVEFDKLTQYVFLGVVRNLSLNLISSV